MSYKQCLALLGDLAKELGVDTPYIVGGVPRDVLLGAKIVFHDFDITNGSKSINKLAEAFAEHLGVSVRTMRDGHRQVFFDGIKYDFSSCFKYDDIDDSLADLKVTDIDELVRETYSRDFTINTLLLTLDLEHFIDITDQGISDLQGGIIQCPLDCTKSFESSPNRILRAFYYKAKFGFKFSPEVKSAIEENLHLLKKVNPRYSGEIINSILSHDQDMLNELVDFGVFEHLELTKKVIRNLLESRRILDVL